MLIKSDGRSRSPMPANREPKGYLKILKEHGLSPIEREIWAVVGKSSNVQGWKLHICSVPVEASHLLSAVVPFLRDASVPFKIAKEERVLCQLNEGTFGGTQIGKFITVYPESDLQARELVLPLIHRTAGFQGPEIVTDIRLGDVVYARYGNFNPVVQRDRLGQIFFCIYAPDGSLHVDAYSVPFVPPAGVNNPFSDLDVPSQFSTDSSPAAINSMDASAKKSNKLLGPGYLLLELIKPDAKGSVFRGIDLRSQELVSAKIIKQGRHHCLSDSYGRDMRSRLKRQEFLHHKLASLSFIPKADPYFEEAGHGYLPIESINGESIEALVVRLMAGQPWPCVSLLTQQKLLSYLEQLIAAIEQLHAIGYVHRDLTASNIWIGEDDQVYILDLELCHSIEDPSIPFGTGTPGFMSPEQASNNPPSFRDDIYALGCVMILLITGIDPRRILFADERSRINKLRGLAGAPFILIETIAQCIDVNPLERPDVQAVHSAVEKVRYPLIQAKDEVAPSEATVEKAGTSQEMLQRLIKGGVKGLLEDYLTDSKHGLWLSTAIKNSTHQANNSLAAAYELRRSANRGVSGIVYLLGRLARYGYHRPVIQRRVSMAVDWLLSGELTTDSGLPGLHFGEAGVAVALAETVASRLVKKDSRIESFIKQALNGKLDWPDVTHGAAGQGLASLYCGDLLRDAELYTHSHDCATYLIETQMSDGSWRLPVGVDGMSGQTLTGFAHGVSGIVYFLSAYAHRFKVASATDAWKAGIQWLMKHAIETDSAVNWSYGDTNADQWRWWCHGAPGIALTFLRLFEQTQDPLYADFASKALSIHPKNFHYGNLSLCHGLSGLGEIYLEASRVLRQPEWLERAENIALVLSYVCRETENGSVLWLVEDPYQPTADLMVGSSGVIHFLLRLSLPGEQMSFPLLL